MKYIWASKNGESGYVLVWVLILVMVASMVLPPFLGFMFSGVTAIGSRADTMTEFYAVDSGIEDAIYKIQNDYSANTILETSINSTATTIPVEDTSLFPVRGIISIETEFIRYEEKSDIDSEFLYCTRGVNSTSSAAHQASRNVFAGLPQTTDESWEYGIEDINSKQVDVTINELWILEGLEEPKSGTMPHADLVIVGRIVNMGEDSVTYGIKAATSSPGMYKIDRIGAWLPSGFNYISGSSTFSTMLTSPINDTSTQINVEDTLMFPKSDGVIAIGYDDEDPDNDELISYASTTGTKLLGCQRGQYGTSASGHSTGDLITNEPYQVPHNGGTALKWDIGPAISYEYLPPPPPVDDFSIGDEFPIRKALFFDFSPVEHPKGIFSWIRTNRNDIYLAWDITSGSYNITSTATDQSTGTYTNVYAYTNRDKKYMGLPPLKGDARAIGNSLIVNELPPDNLREKLLPFSSASISDIPIGAWVESAHLYWSGWKSNTDDLAYTPGDIENVESLAQMVDEATFTIDSVDLDLVADRVQLLPTPGGWAFSSSTDITTMLQPEKSAAVAVTPFHNPEFITIAPSGNPTPNIEITADGGNPGAMTIIDGNDAITLGPGEEYEINSLTQEIDLFAGTSAAGDYDAIIDCTKGTVLVGDVSLPKTDDPMPVTLVTTRDENEITISWIDGGMARCEVTRIDTSEGDMVVDGESLGTGEMGTPTCSSINPNYTITGTDTWETYEALINCVSGSVMVKQAGHQFRLDSSGTGTANVDYTLSNVEAYDSSNMSDDDLDGVLDDLNNEWSYAGWSLVVIYSHPDADTKHFFLHDTFLNAPSAAPGDTNVASFVYKGFNTPDHDTGSWLVYFVGEGDQDQSGEYIKFKAPYDAGGENLDDADNPENNVFNGSSSGITDVDIDIFDVSTLLPTDTTSLAVELGTQSDSWNLIYLLVGVRTTDMNLTGAYPTSITIYSFDGE
ncbi:hypothetical protein ACFLTP_03225 [Chloroflexota bacterium]